MTSCFFGTQTKILFRLKFLRPLVSTLTAILLSLPITPRYLEVICNVCVEFHSSGSFLILYPDACCPSLKYALVGWNDTCTPNSAAIDKIRIHRCPSLHIASLESPLTAHLWTRECFQKCPGSVFLQCT